jgi:catechol 2,3-dioxygenase-like lactoylglutathione lyase family enzyme
MKGGMMEGRISIITLGTMDMERSVAFYRDGLGWKTDYTPADGIAFFKLSGTWMGIYPWDALAEDANLPSHEIRFGGITLAHNVGSKEEVDAVFKEAIDAGAAELKAPEDAFWGGYSGYFADPDGHPWEVAWNPHFKL